MAALDSSATTGRNPSDPSPEEIAELCEAIQSTWTAPERRKRAVGLTNSRWARPADVATGWTPPEYSAADLPLEPDWLT